jgi:serine/threonine protein kinase
MHVKDRLDIRKCAEREIYFGTLLQGNSLFSRFESYFSTDDDFWLVFRDEGISLNNLLYAAVSRDMNPILEPSLFWKKLRTTQNGQYTMRGIIHQLIKGIAVLHSKDILHRDIKPSNILINSEDDNPRVVIADFSSAVAATNMKLYDQLGPSGREETEKYSPPEVLRTLLDQDFVAYDPSDPYSYDIWSIGVVFLELLLGTDEVFSVDQRTSAMIRQRLRGADEKKIKLGSVVFMQYIVKVKRDV